MIRLENVSFGYTRQGRRIEVLENADAAFPRGRIIGVIGHRGAGKSTLIRLLTGGLRPESGAITGEGSVSWIMTSQRAMMGLISVRSNLRFIAQLYRVDPPLFIERVRDLSGIDALIDARMSELPREMQARVCFSACLALQFDTYIADEAMLIGEGAFRLRAQKVLERLLHGRTLIIATRHPVVLRRYCDTAFLLHHGKLRAFPDINDAIAAYKGIAPEKPAPARQLELTHS